MGIHGIFKEIGPGCRIALSKLAVQKFEETGRPLRLAIDTSIWLFQIQATKGGTNPALRTFYYRLLRLMSLSIHPLFVFDGPNRPEFKRNKRVGGGKAQVASIPEFLAKQLLKQFGFPCHLAPGEAEAECALLQSNGIVDAVLSEDVDTLMFGSKTTIKNWSPPQGSKSKTPTHVDLYDAAATKASSGLDREGMILVAMMSGGDYITEGIPGIGPKLACEAARAGFGKDLCSIAKSDTVALTAWKENLQHELKTNESKYFRTKHAAITIPDEFPNMDVLRYYTNPIISSKEKLDRLRQTLSWDMDIDYHALRAFTADAFSWTNLGGAKHFIRNLATPLLVRELRLRGQRPEKDLEVSAVEQEEARLVHSIHGRRTHISTDQTSEMRVAFKPIELIPIDLDAEEPDEELPVDEEADEQIAIEDLESTQGASKPRGPTKYDPTALERVWIMETFVRVGVPLTVQDWEEAYRDPKMYIAMKYANKAASKPRKKVTKTGGMQPGALDRFAKISKPGVAQLSPARASDYLGFSSPPPLKPAGLDNAALPTPLMCLAQSGPKQPEVFSLLSSSPARPTAETETTTELLSTVTKRRKRSPLRRSQTSPASLFHPSGSPGSTAKVAEVNLIGATVPSPSQAFPLKRLKTTNTRPARSSSQKHQNNKDAIILSSSPPRTIDAWIRRSQSVTPKKAVAAGQQPDPLSPVPEGSPSKPARLEVRTARISDDLRVTQAAIASIDLTDHDIGLPPSKRRYPSSKAQQNPPNETISDVALSQVDPLFRRRRWDKFPPLTETSGNQPPTIRRELKTAQKISASTFASTAPAPAPAPAPTSKPVEKMFVQVNGLSDGFWQEIPASKVKTDATKPTRRKKTPEVLVWALDDVKVIDLTGSA